MKPDDVKKYYRSTYNFMKETGISSSTLCNWLRLGFVPKNSQYRLEHITKGELKTQWSENGSNEVK
jgi:hypothetical protein